MLIPIDIIPVRFLEVVQHCFSDGLLVHNYPYVLVASFLSDFWLPRENLIGDPGFQAAVGPVTVQVNSEWTPMHANGAVG